VYLTSFGKRLFQGAFPAPMSRILFEILASSRRKKSLIVLSCKSKKHRVKKATGFSLVQISGWA
jgi:hypothetical protein